MGRLSKRRGAISIFLLIIFMVTYVFMGMLVDAGRYRIAQTYMESALDNASSSVLSNYNQLVFDLYGLFSVDMELEEGQTMEDAIYEKYNHYLQKTLGIAEVDTSQYRTLLSDLIFGAETATYTTDSLYDFNITKLEAGSVITLADTANVEQQLIEYMKFRAPVELTKEMEGFLEKLQAIVGMKERVEESLKKEQIKQKYESDKNGNVPLSEQAATLLKDINEFAGDLYNYTLEPQKSLSELQARSVPSKSEIYNHNPYRIMDYVDEFDQALVQAEQDYRNVTQEENKEHGKKLYKILEELQKELKENKNEEGKVKFIVKISNNYNIAGNTTEKSDILHLIELPSQTEAEELEEICLSVIRGIDSLDATEKEKIGDFFDDFFSDYKTELNRHNQVLSNMLPEYKLVLDEAQEKLSSKLKNMENNAGRLYNTASNLVNRIYTTVSNYEAYVKELETAQSQGNEDGSNQNKKTVYATEIELAQANMGELLKNLDLLANSRAYLDDIASGLKDNQGTRHKLSDDLVNVAEVLVNEWKEKPEEDKVTAPLKGKVAISNDNYTNGNQSINLYKEGYAVASISNLASSLMIVRNVLPEIQEYMCVLYSHVSYFQTGHYRQDVDVIVGEKNKVWTEEVSSSKAAEQGNTEIKEENGRKLDSEKIKNNANLLKVNYSYTSDVGFEEFDTSVSAEGEVDSGTIITMLQTGLNLITRIGDLLESARDNLYVDAYILSMFPNYKDHYKDYEKNKEDSILASPKGEYLASYAEVEFIITGAGANGSETITDRVFVEGTKGFGQLSVESMRLKLFGTRMLFNSLAMLTDSAKLQQASVLSTWAGPFAPLVSAVLIVCWIVAETVLDIMILMGDLRIKGKYEDGEIPLFKQSKDWLFSLSGVVESLANYAVDTISKQIMEKASALTDSLQSQANVMIYQAYNAADTGISNVNSAIDSAVEKGTNALNNWNTNLQKNLSEFSEEEGLAQTQGLANELSNLSGELQTVASQKDQLVEVANSVTSNAKEQAVLAVNRMSDTIMEKTENYVERAGNSAKEFIRNNVSRVVPVGTVVNGGTSDITMGYRDYLYFFLFIMNQETKVQRIQAVIQANINSNKEGNFILLEESPVSVWADLETTMKYMFMSNSIVPESWKRDGRMRVKVISAQSY